MLIFYRFDSRMYHDLYSYRYIDKNLSFSNNYYAKEYPPFKKYCIDYEERKNYENLLTYGFIDFLPVIYGFLNKIYLITIVLFLILYFFIIISFLKNKKNRDHFLFGTIIFILFLYNFSINLTTAMINTLEVSRYIRDQIIISIFFQFASLYFIYIIFSDLWFVKIKPLIKRKLKK